MSDTHETIADIIAEMRRGTRLPGYWRSCDVNEILQYHADQLEAAHKRDTKELRVEIERLKEERNYSGVRERERLRAKGFAIVPKEQLARGDAAKLREALVQAELFVGNIVRHGHQTLVPGDKCTACDGAEELRDMICAALAEPPRNCDRYSEYKVVDEFERQMGRSPSRTADEQDEYMRENWFLFYKWLFATSKEGGAK